MNARKKLIPIYTALVAIVLIILVIVLGSGGTSSNPGGGDWRTGYGDPPPVVIGELTPRQQAALSRLAEISEIKPTIYSFDKVLYSLSTRVLIPDSVAVGPKAKADHFIAQYSDLFELTGDDELFFSKEDTDVYGNTYVRYTQMHEGLPVFGSDILVSISDDNYIEYVGAGYVPTPQVNTNPSIDIQEAVRKAREVFDGDETLRDDPKLVIFDERVFGRGDQEESHLAWVLRMQASLNGGEYTYIIDAMSGDVLDVISEILTARNRRVFDAAGEEMDDLDTSNNVVEVMDEGGALPGETVSDDAREVWTNTAIVYDYYWNSFRRDGFDDSGHVIETYVDVDYDCPNAAWHRIEDILVFCQDVVGLDVVAHEFTHGLVDFTAGLANRRDAGALNESYADFFAAMIDNQDPWRITMDANGNQLIRDMGSPGPNAPVHLDDARLDCPFFRRVFGDGCVHTRSAVPSLAAYLAAEGGEHRGVEVDGIGRTKLQYIYYLTLVHRLPSNSDFTTNGLTLIQSCISLIGHHNITREDCDQVQNAQAAIGIGEPAAAPTPPGDQDGEDIEVESPEEASASLYTATVLVLDTSGSMDQMDPSGVRKLDAAISAGTGILEVIRSENAAQSDDYHQVGLVEFNANARTIYSMSTDVSEAIQVIDLLDTAGRTAMASGLDQGIDLLEDIADNQRKVIILLSDGLPNIGLNATTITHDAAKREVLEKASEAGDKSICVNTVGFGDPNQIDPSSGDPLIDEEFLRDVAANSGCGEYYTAKNADELANIFILLRHQSAGGEIVLNSQGLISQGEEVDIGDLTVSRGATSMLYTLRWPGSELEPLLVDPRGVLVTESYAGASISVSDSLATVIIQNPQAGVWQVKAKGVDVPGGETTYSAVVSNRMGAPTSSGGGFGTVIIILLVAVAVVIVITTQSRKVSKKPLSGAYIQVVRSDGSVEQLLLTQDFAIGRSPRNDVQIREPDVSRLHALIRYGEGAWFIQDQNSKTGIKVNGNYINATRLHHGDSIEIGRTLIRFWTG